MSEPNKLDRLYINLNKFNTGDSYEKASVSFVRPNGFLDRPSDYQLVVNRFSIPFRQVPLIDFKDEHWSVTLSCNGQDFMEYLEYVPSASSAIPGQPNQPVFEIQNFVQSVNNAFAQAFADLKAGVVTSTAVSQPTLHFRLDSRFSLFIPDTGYGDGNNLTQVYFNFRLAEKLQGFNYFFDYVGVPISNGKDAMIVLGGLNSVMAATVAGGSNGSFYNATMLASPVGASNALYTEYIQEFPALDAFVEFNRILILCNNLPIRTEYYQGPTEVSSNASLPILADFLIDTGGTLSSRQDFYYNNPSDIRPIDLMSESEITNMTLEVYYTGKEGGLYPLIFSHGQNLSFKLEFVRKGAIYTTPVL